jgi:glutamine synthetase
MGGELQVTISVNEADAGAGNTTDLIALTWVDLCGIARVRSIPLKYLESKSDYGLSFPSCGQALTMFGDIIDNPWGAVGDVRQIPVMSTLLQPVDGGFGMVLSEAIGSDGAPWDLCGRTLLSCVVERYKKLGLVPWATFEQEFKLFGEKPPALCMTIDALRQISPLDNVIVKRLEDAGIQVEAFEPEYVASQYEVSVAPKEAVRAADEAVILRETVRDSARQHGYKATFAPKTSFNAGGSGLHIHISLENADGEAALFDSNGPSNLSEQGSAFVGGILKHARALLPFVAPGVSSYYRLGPGKWSSGYAAYGTANREAMIRLCSLPTRDIARKARSFNIEFRSSDGLCNPYLALSVILIAGLLGIREKVALPPAFEVNPGKLSPKELGALNLTPLPSSLEEALGGLETDDIFRRELPKSLVEIFVALRRDEAKRVAGMSRDEICKAYSNVY